MDFSFGLNNTDLCTNDRMAYNCLSYLIDSLIKVFRYLASINGEPEDFTSCSSPRF